MYGLRPGDRAVVAMRNHPEWQIAFWAAQLAGLVAVPLNAWWTEDEFTYALDDCAPRVLLVDGERLPRVAAWAAGGPGVAGRRLLHGEAGAGRGPSGTRTSRRPTRSPRRPRSRSGPRTTPPSSTRPGTTGRPKGAVATQLAQAGAALNPRLPRGRFRARAAGSSPGQGPAPVTLMTFPFFHVAAFTSFYAAMAAGGTLVLMRKWDAEEALRLIRAAPRHALRRGAGHRAPAA